MSQASGLGRACLRDPRRQNEVTDKPGAADLPPVQGGSSSTTSPSATSAAASRCCDGVSFVAEPGQTVALLGATGSGKRTIINLIPRFYDASAGRVLIDGHDVRDVTLDSLRAQIGIVLQETNLFSGTIRDNIAFGRPRCTDRTRCQAAAKAPPRTTSSRAFRRATTRRWASAARPLAGGQKQRIAIARALLLDPRILILDDSTSSVDVPTEYHIQQALDRPDGRAHQLRHRPAHQHRAQRRPDPGAGQGPDRGRAGTHAELMERARSTPRSTNSQLVGDAPAGGCRAADHPAT